MADNFTANAGSGGDTFASDEIGAVQYPISKIGVGPLDSVTLLSGGTGTDNAGAPRVSLATNVPLPAGTNEIGKLAAGTAEIGKLAAGTAGIGKINNGALNGPLDPTIDSYQNIALNLSAAANQSLVAAPGASKQIWVYGVGFTVDTALTSVSFQDEDDVAISGVMIFALNGGLNSAPSGNFAMPLWKVATNKALEVDLVTGGFDGWLAYAVVSV